MEKVIEILNRMIEEAAKFASSVLAGDTGNFDRIFLFHFLGGEKEAYEIAPELTAASQS